MVVGGKLKPCAHMLTVGTWNVRTMWAPGKLKLLENEMERYRFDILGLAEMPVSYTHLTLPTNREV